MFSRFTTQSILSKRMDILYMVSYSHIIICINQAIYVYKCMNSTISTLGGFIYTKYGQKVKQTCIGQSLNSH